MKNYSSGALAQDATRSKPARKPPVSETGLKASEPLLVDKLPCQKVPDHYKPCNRTSLPQDMILVPENKHHTELDMDVARETAEKKRIPDQSNQKWDCIRKSPNMGSCTCTCFLCRSSFDAY